MGMLMPIKTRIVIEYQPTMFLGLGYKIQLSVVVVGVVTLNNSQGAVHLSTTGSILAQVIVKISVTCRIVSNATITMKMKYENMKTKKYLWLRYPRQLLMNGQ